MASVPRALQKRPPGLRGSSFLQHTLGQLPRFYSLPSCLHLLNSAFNKLASIIQLRVASVSSWDCFSWKTAGPTLPIPPSLFLLPPFSFGAGGSVGSPIALLICSVAGLVPGWSGTEYSFFRSR